MPAGRGLFRECEPPNSPSRLLPTGEARSVLPVPTKRVSRAFNHLTSRLRSSRLDPQTGTVRFLSRRRPFFLRRQSYCFIERARPSRAGLQFVSAIHFSRISKGTSSGGLQP